MEDPGLAEVLAKAEQKLSSKYGLKNAHWDNTGIKNPAEAIKEMVDNCFMKAGEDLDRLAVPWNANNVEVRTELIATMDGQIPVLFVCDNGRGLDLDEFIEGFHDRSHSESKLPQRLQSNSISQFGTGSKDADAFMATGVYYFTVPVQSKPEHDYTIIGRAGKDLAQAIGEQCLWVQHEVIPNQFRRQLQDNPGHKCNTALLDYWDGLRHLRRLTGEDGKGPFHTASDKSGLNRALELCNQCLPLGCSGFMRMLMLRPSRVLMLGSTPLQPGPMPAPDDGTDNPVDAVAIVKHEEGTAAGVGGASAGKGRSRASRPAQPPKPRTNINPGTINQLEPTGNSLDKGLMYETGPGVRHVSISRVLEENYLLPPELEGAADPELVQKQREVVQGLQAQDYYLHPTSGKVYSPSVIVQGERVNWGNNVLLRNLKYDHSPVLLLPPDEAAYGDSDGQPPARVVVTYLGHTHEERRANDSMSGVSVYVGCRRVCDPELPDGNWSLGGQVAAVMEHAKTLSSWSIFHSTHTVGTRLLLGPELFKEAKSMAKAVFDGARSSILALRGAHLAIVVKPGLLDIALDKKGFMTSPEAQALLLDALRLGIRWILHNPPGDSDPEKCLRTRLAAHLSAGQTKVVPKSPAPGPADTTLTGKRKRSKNSRFNSDDEDEDDEEEEEDMDDDEQGPNDGDDEEEAWSDQPAAKKLAAIAAASGIRTAKAAATSRLAATVGTTRAGSAARLAATTATTSVPASVPRITVPVPRSSDGAGGAGGGSGGGVAAVKGEGGSRAGPSSAVPQFKVKGVPSRLLSSDAPGSGQKSQGHSSLPVSPTPSRPKATAAKATSAPPAPAPRPPSPVRHTIKSLIDCVEAVVKKQAGGSGTTQYFKELKECLPKKSSTRITLEGRVPAWLKKKPASSRR